MLNDLRAKDEVVIMLVSKQKRNKLVKPMLLRTVLNKGHTAAFKLFALCYRFCFLILILIMIL